EIPRRLIDVLTRVGDHLTPGWLISADTESDKGQDRFNDNSKRHFETDERNQKRRRSRKDFATDGRPVREAQKPSRRDIIVAPYHQHFAAQHATEAGPVNENNGEDDVAQADAEPDHQDQRKNDRRK